MGNRNFLELSSVRNTGQSGYQISTIFLGMRIIFGGVLYIEKFQLLYLILTPLCVLIFRWPEMRTLAFRILLKDVEVSYCTNVHLVLFSVMKDD